MRDKLPSSEVSKGQRVIVPRRKSMNAELHISPVSGLLDTPLSIAIRGLASGARVTLRAHMPGPPRWQWESWATFVADDQGLVDLAATAPVAGTYATTDPMAMIWSMSLTESAGPPSAQRGDRLAPVPVRFSLEGGDSVIAEACIERLILSPGISRIDASEAGIAGVLFRPAEGRECPGIILVGGAEGGWHEHHAALLSSHGYAVLALAYFRAEGVPEDLVNIPLEYFDTAMTWLQAQQGVRADRLGIHGGSRGGELALLLASRFPRLTAVVSVNGSGLLTQGIGGREVLDMLNTGQPSWTSAGQPLPYLPSASTPDVEARIRRGEPFELRDVFDAALQAATQDDIVSTTIPVERINGAVLMLSAGDDRSWPSVRLSQIAAERLAAHGHSHFFEHVIYPDAGHGIIPPPYGPTTLNVIPLPGGSMFLGGTPGSDAAARASAWQRTLDFFAMHLQA